MTNRKHTKRALVLSALSLLLCVSMLVGSTMAWFTDSATTGVNKIESGIIDIRLENPTTGENLEGKTLKWMVQGEPADSVLWEPGATFYTEPVRVMNYSNLSFYMQGFINGIVGDTKLLDAIDFKIVHAYACLPADQGGLGLSFDQCSGRSYVYNAGPSVFEGQDKIDLDNFMADSYGTQADWTDDLNDYDNDGELEAGPGVGQPKPLYDLCIIGHMKEEAGNEYQGLTMSGIGLTFRATQSPYEYDSYDNMYDKDAEFPTVLTAGKEYTSGTNTHDLIFNSLEVVDDGNGTAGLKATDGELVIEGNGYVKMTAQPNSYAMAVWATGTSAVTIKEGTYTLESTSDEEYDLIYVNSKDASITIEGGTYKSCYPAKTLGVKNHGLGTITVKGGSFWEYDPSKPEADDKAYIIIPAGYKVVSETKADGTWYTVVAE